MFQRHEEEQVPAGWNSQEGSLKEVARSLEGQQDRGKRTVTEEEAGVRPCVCGGVARSPSNGLRAADEFGKVGGRGWSLGRSQGKVAATLDGSGFPLSSPVLRSGLLQGPTPQLACLPSFAWGWLTSCGSDSRCGLSLGLLCHATRLLSVPCICQRDGTDPYSPVGSWARAGLLLPADAHCCWQLPELVLSTTGLFLAPDNEVMSLLRKGGSLC